MRSWRGGRGVSALARSDIRTVRTGRTAAGSGVRAAGGQDTRGIVQDAGSVDHDAVCRGRWDWRAAAMSFRLTVGMSRGHNRAQYLRPSDGHGQRAVLRFHESPASSQIPDIHSDDYIDRGHRNRSEGATPGPAVLLIAVAMLAGAARDVFTLLQATAISDRWGSPHYGRLGGILTAPDGVGVADRPERPLLRSARAATCPGGPVQPVGCLSPSLRSHDLGHRRACEGDTTRTLRGGGPFGPEVGCSSATPAWPCKLRHVVVLVGRGSLGA
jgi:hypothetical protein